jgi:hypothetical protein
LLWLGNCRAARGTSKHDLVGRWRTHLRRASEAMGTLISALRGRKLVREAFSPHGQYASSALEECVDVELGRLSPATSRPQRIYIRRVVHEAASDYDETLKFNSSFSPKAGCLQDFHVLSIIGRFSWLQ